jgi:hypothetical protein
MNLTIQKARFAEGEREKEAEAYRRKYADEVRGLYGGDAR